MCGAHITIQERKKKEGDLLIKNIKKIKWNFFRFCLFKMQEDDKHKAQEETFDTGPFSLLTKTVK
jgi:hypothetical protein